MKRTAVAALLLALATPAFAAMKPGDKAPDFTAQAAVGGEEFTFSLGDALKKGPVVLYFFPKAFTKGCTAEAHDFAEAAERYKAAGATLIGMSSHMRRGSVIAPDPDRNSETTSSSNEVMKANRAPTSTPGRIRGSVTCQKVPPGVARRPRAACSSLGSMPVRLELTLVTTNGTARQA